MALAEELEFYKKSVISFQQINAQLEQDNDALKAKSWNLGIKLQTVEAERDKLLKEVAEIKEKNKEMLNKQVQRNNEHVDKIKSLEDANKDIKNKGIQLQKVYKEGMNKYYEQCMSEIAKARITSRRQEVIDCVQRNGGNKKKAAKELGISRQAVYDHLNKR